MLDGSILLLAAILNPRARRRRAEEARADSIASGQTSPRYVKIRNVCHAELNLTTSITSATIHVTFEEEKGDCKESKDEIFA